MPKIKINHVVSFSSEDPIHCANNLLLDDPSKKWKCLKPGEKSASVILQLEKASIISSIDIGNEHSAYVEIFAGRSSSNDDFKILLVMSSFMTPVESKQSVNINKVRMFNKDLLQDPERNEKWDRIKIVCTQPFNRHIQYGLSFISFNSPADSDENVPKAKIGRFLLRPDSPDHISAGSLFNKRKELSQDQPLTGAAAIRQASSLALQGSSSAIPKLKDTSIITKNNKATPNLQNSGEIIKKERNRDEIFYDKLDDDRNEKIDKIIEKKNNEVQEKKIQEQKTSDKKKEDSKNSPSIKKNNEKVSRRKNSFDSASTSSQKNGENKRKSSESLSSHYFTPNKKVKPGIQKKPFKRLLEGVVLVISGIQQPERGEIRSKALEMGSKYKPDWDLTCTHLICAFPNTPKFNQVRGKGKIVTKNWINDCYRQRIRFPWRRYALDKKDKNEDESEEEIWEEKTLGDLKISDNRNGNNDGSDTEDEIERIQNIQRKNVDEAKPKFDPYSADTEDEDIPEISREKVNHQLPTFFEHHSFYIDEDFPDDIIKKLQKYITAYKGVFVEEKNKSVTVDIVLTEMKNKNKNFKQLYPEAKVVDYNWIWECHNHQKLTPLDNFML